MPPFYAKMASIIAVSVIGVSFVAVRSGVDVVNVRNSLHAALPVASVSLVSIVYVPPLAELFDTMRNVVVTLLYEHVHVALTSGTRAGYAGSVIVRSYVVGQ